MKKYKFAALSIALAATMVVPTSAHAVEYNAYSAVCDVSDGVSTFTAVKRGYYSWTWRTGTTVDGYGTKYLNAGQSWAPSNPGSVTNTSRFGVVTASKTFAYVTCQD